MNKLKWWLWIVGGFYLLLGLAGLGYFLFAPDGYAESYAATLPLAYRDDPLAVTAVIDRDFFVTFEWIVLGALMFVASRDPSRARFFIGAMVALEFFQYIVVDVIWMIRGYPNMVPYLILHLIFGVTGFVFLRQPKAE
ncbi:MAG: hypothetical protein AB1649_30915 [Chloroflexota bacterium]